tara:strand:+ start:191 stop:376 length:186 start_codon:yes stop_codon:yes gene_type:complete
MNNNTVIFLTIRFLFDVKQQINKKTNGLTIATALKGEIQINKEIKNARTNILLSIFKNLRN